MQTLQVNTTLNINDIRIKSEYEKLVPQLTKDEYIKLKNSIENDGLYEPIVVNTNFVILDGHHRWKACNELGILPRFTIKKFKNNLYERKYVIEVNLFRRQLNVFQKVELSLNLIDLEREKADYRRTANLPNQSNAKILAFGRTEEIIAQKINSNHETVRQALYVIENAPEEYKEKTRKGTNRGGWSIWNAFKQTKHLVEKPETPPKMPQGLFNVIYADPPWHYTHSFLAGAPDRHYTTMETEEICKLEVPSYRDAVLFLWVTNPLLEDGFKVLNSWGFDYKTNLVWVKDRPGTGHYVRGQHELLLIATKGSIGTPPTIARVSSVLMTEKREHSRKPDEVYEIIEAMYPESKYLELFARERRQNWISWGIEI